MKKTNLLFSGLLSSGLLLGSLAMVGCTDSKPDAETTNPETEMSTNIAWQDSQARFTVIADGVIRMEYDKDGQFCDCLL